PPDRVRIERPGPRDDYLRLAGEVDVLLDAFPFGGHTTSCEYLWMGVPAVTLRGHLPAGRVTASLLTAVGLPELIAETTEEYVAVARLLAGDLAALGRLRQELR